MKKNIILSVLTVLTSVFLTACGPQQAENLSQVENARAVADMVQEAGDKAQAAAEAVSGSGEKTQASAEAVSGSGEKTQADAEASAGTADKASQTSDALQGADAPASVGPAGNEEEKASGKTEIQVFIAASLNTVMKDIAAKYNETHPDVNIVFNADSSGTLMTQIEEGFACDIFFSAAQKQMNTLEEEGLLVEGTRKNVVNNQVVVVTLKDSGTAVTGLSDIEKAESIALADGSVPVGRYTRQALVNLKKLPETEDVSAITTAEVSEALGGAEISEQSNVSKVLAAVTEGSCQVGTTYYSDTYGYEDKLDILERVDYSLTGDVIYPVSQVVNPEADEAEKEAAADFLGYITSDEAKQVFDSYYFDTEVE